MIAGLVFQVVSLCVFSAICADFAWRLHKNRDKWSRDYAEIYNSRLFRIFIWSMIPNNTNWRLFWCSGHKLNANRYL
jgi:hypothetical protein